MRIGRAVKGALAILLLLAALVVGCGSGGTATTADGGRSAGETAVGGSGVPAGATSGAARRELAGSLADQERALGVLLEVGDLPGGWRAEGRAVSGLSAASPAVFGRGSDADLLGIRCLAADERSPVAALARAPVFVRDGGTVEDHVVVYADDAGPTRTLAALRRPAFRDCFAETIAAAQGAGRIGESQRGGAKAGKVRSALVDLPEAGVDGVALAFTADGRRVADVVALQAGPALSFLQIAWPGKRDEALRDALAGEIAERMRALYG